MSLGYVQSLANKNLNFSSDGEIQPPFVEFSRRNCQKNRDLVIRCRLLERSLPQHY